MSARMARLNLRLLGDFEARLGSGPPLRLRARKTQALLAYLASPPGQTHTRDKLASILWGDRSQPQARSRLRGSLFILRRVLVPANPRCLVVDNEAVTLNADAVDIDAVAFARLVQVDDPDALSGAVELYRGDFLEGLAFRGALFEDWLSAERERLRELAVAAMAKLLAHRQRSAVSVESALQTALRLIALDPLLEPVHRSVMRLYDRLGRRGAALRHYQVCVGVLQRELGVEPEEETKQLYQEILRRRSSRVATSEPFTSGDSPPSATVRRRPWILGTDGPLIGRGREMARIRAALEEAASGRGQVVVVAGEEGVGKTRLIAELASEAAGMNARILIGRGHESEQILAFGLWTDALAIGPELVNDAWLKTVPLATRRELGRLLPKLAPAEDEPAPSPDYLKLFEGVRTLLGHVTARQLTVLILEDLHWADEMSIRLLAFIGRRLQAWRLLLVATARDEDLAEAPMLQRTLHELEGEPHVAMVTVGPLSRDDTISLVKALSRRGRDEVADLVERVWRISSGNPFVVVEAMRVAAQDALLPGPEVLPVPERVRDLIGRRLDRLDERQRELAALAAVIGREFEFGLLHHVSECGEEETARGVEELTRRRVLHNVGDCLDFTHDRVREVAYSRILRTRRQLLHRRVAEALATLYAESVDSHHLALGLHYAEGEVWDKAVVHLRRAGARAFERSANRDAVACFERALAALAHLPDNRSSLEHAFEIRLEMRPVLSLLGEILQTLGRLREAEVLAERLNDDRGRGRVCAFMTNTHMQFDELDEARASGARALAIARSQRDLDLQILTMTYLAEANYFGGEYERAAELATDNLAALPAGRIYERFGNASPVSVYDRNWLISSLAELGRFQEATRYSDEAINIAKQTDHAFTVGIAFTAARRLHSLKGDWVKARSVTEQGIAVVRTGDVLLLLPPLIAASAVVLAQLGETSEALDRLAEGEQLLERQTMNPRNLGVVCSLLSRACLLLGRLDEALSLGDRAIEHCRRQPGFAAHALHLLGDIGSHPERFDAEHAETHYRRALGLAEPRGMRPLVAHCHLGFGKLYRDTGQREQAQEHLTTATTMYREMEMRFWLEQAEVELQALA
jgi:predicted ATPase/DNA-binding SARP family transcriptional activator